MRGKFKKITVSSMLDNVRAITLKNSTQRPDTWEDRILCAYTKHVLHQLTGILSSENTDSECLLASCELFLQTHVKTFQFTMFSYTSLPNHDITKLLCDVGRFVVAEKSKNAPISPDHPPVALLSVLMSDVCRESVHKSYPDLNPIWSETEKSWLEIDVERVFATHIIGSTGQYLIPLQMMTDASNFIAGSPLKNYYSGKNGSLYLNTNEAHRLLKHIALSLKKRKITPVNPIDVSLPKMLTAILEDTSYGFDGGELLGFGKDTLDVLKHSIVIKSHHDLNVFSRLNADGISSICQSQDLLRQVVQHINDIAQLATLCQELSPEQLGCLLPFIADDLGRRHLRHNGVNNLLGLITNLDVSRCAVVCDVFKDYFYYTITNKATFISLISGINIDKRPIICKLLKDKFVEIIEPIESIQSIESFVALAQYCDDEIKVSIFELSKLNLLKQVRTASYFNLLLRHLPSVQRHSIFMELIKTLSKLLESNSDFNKITEYLNDEDKALFYHGVRTMLKTHIKSVKDYQNVMQVLPKELQSDFNVYIEDKRKGLIVEEGGIAIMRLYHNDEQDGSFYKAYKEQIGRINSLRDLIKILNHLDVNYYNEFFTAYDNQVRDIVYDASSLNELQRILSPDQLNEFCVFFKEHLLAKINKSKKLNTLFTSTDNISKFKVICDLVKDKLPSLLSSPEELLRAIRFLKKNQMEVFGSYLTKILPQIITDARHLKRIIDVLHDSYSELLWPFYQSCGDLIPSVIVSRNDWIYLIRKFNPMQRNEIYSVHLEKIVTQIDSSYDVIAFVELMGDINQDLFIKLLADKFSSVFKHSWDFEELLRVLTDEQTVTLCKALTKKLDQMFSSGSQLNEFIESLRYNLQKKVYGLWLEQFPHLIKSLDDFISLARGMETNNLLRLSSLMDTHYSRVIVTDEDLMILSKSRMGSGQITIILQSLYKLGIIPTIIKSSSSFKFVVTYLGNNKGEIGHLCQGINERLPQLIRSVNDLNTICNDLDNHNFNLVYKPMKAHLSTLSVTANDLLLFKDRGHGEREFLFTAIQTKLPDIINTALLFNQFFPRIDAKERDIVYDALKNELNSLCVSVDALIMIFDPLDNAKRSDLYAAVKARLPDLCTTLNEYFALDKKLGSYFQLKSAQQLELFLAVKSKFSVWIHLNLDYNQLFSLFCILDQLPTEHTDDSYAELHQHLVHRDCNLDEFKKILEALNLAQSSVFIQNYKDKLSQLFDSAEALAQVVYSLGVDKTRILYTGLKDRIPEIINTPESLLRIARAEGGQHAVGIHDALKQAFIRQLENYREKRDAEGEYLRGWMGLFQSGKTQKLAAVDALIERLNGKNVDLEPHLSVLRNGRLGHLIRTYIKSGMMPTLCDKTGNTVRDLIEALQEQRHLSRPNLSVGD